ncbi:MAG TPA: tetratricopeptide repeat protein [bacterium]|nr:tetratricopeptide repeat protein [bacterium]
MSRQPSGTITLLFTDIEGSTDLVRRLGDSRYARVLMEHRRLLRTICRREGGEEIGHQGDGLFVTFARVEDAVRAAVAAQRAILEHAWPDGIVPRVRMGIHTGEPASEAGELVGLDLHRAARICAAGHGGQILLSAAAATVIQEDPAASIVLRGLGSHRLRDLPQPERIFQTLHPDLPDNFPPLRSADAAPNNLPARQSSFVGRDRELAEIEHLLSTTSTLTLTGIGGSGKTRLAIETARELVEALPDGAWLVELGALADGGLVLNTVASALNVRAGPASTLEETLLEYLRPRTLLLILDNCEHLAAACATFVSIITRSCPAVRVLATSREALNVPGEVVWPVPSLSLPASGDGAPLDELMEYEAPRLFIERAAAVRPGFAPTSHDAQAIAAICRRLDGIPLAIELAAARVPVLSVGQIATRLDERFRLLTGGSRTAAPRQRTLRGALDWSYDLLSPKERALLRRVAVFAGGSTLEGCEAICAGKGIDSSDVLDLLTQLIAKSLVVMETHGEQVRYRMLETVREYGAERLVEANESASIRSRHRDWYLMLAEQAEAQLGGAEQVAWLRRLQSEYDNLRAALEWSRSDEGTAGAGMRLALGLWQFWYVRGDFSEGRMWLETMLRRHLVPDALRAKVLGQAGFLAWRQGDYAGAADLGTEGLAIFRGLDDAAGMGGALYLLGNVAFYQGDLARAKTLLLESLARRRAAGDKRPIAISLNSLGEVARAEGDYRTARAAYEESLALAREAGDQRGAATATGNLGYVALQEGDAERAARLLREGLASAKQLVHKLGIAGYLAGLAGAAGLAREHPRAARLIGATRTLLRALGASLTTPDRSQYESTLEATRAALGDEMISQLIEEGAAMTLEQAVDYALARNG